MNNYPKIPQNLSTIRAGNVLARWKERRTIIIQQRGILLAELKTVAPLTFISGVQRVKSGLVGRIDTLTARIDECNEVIDSLANIQPASVSLIVGRAQRKKKAS